MVNKVILLGRLGKDPEMRYTAQGAPVTAFSLATERTWKDAEGTDHKETEWHQVVAWHKLAEACYQYLKKGSLVYLEGRLHTRDWEDGNKVTHRRTEVIAEGVKFLDGRRNRRRIGGEGEEALP
jgi:single-strand DNA-binding protein